MTRDQLADCLAVAQPGSLGRTAVDAEVARRGWISIERTEQRARAAMWAAVASAVCAGVTIAMRVVGG